MMLNKCGLYFYKNRNTLFGVFAVLHSVLLLFGEIGVLDKSWTFGTTLFLSMFFVTLLMCFLMKKTGLDKIFLHTMYLVTPAEVREVLSPWLKAEQPVVKVNQYNKDTLQLILNFLQGDKLFLSFKELEEVRRFVNFCVA